MEILHCTLNDKERGRENWVLLNIGWFSTGRDEAARQLLQAVQDKLHSGKINDEISFVFSNREPGEAKESDLFYINGRAFLSTDNTMPKVSLGN